MAWSKFVDYKPTYTAKNNSQNNQFGSFNHINNGLKQPISRQNNSDGLI